jgi:hypothetical protein
VPLFVDQFGASIDSSGQLDYERGLILFLESQDVHWTRWGYNAG